MQSDRRRWEDGDKLDPILYAAVSKRAVMKIACPRISRPPNFQICPFRIIAIASKPANVLRAVGTAEAEPRSDQTLDAPMILLDNIIQILALPGERTAPEFAVSLHLRDRPWIGGVLVDRERARIDGVRLRERLAEEPLRRRIAPCGQQEVDRLPAAVHRPIEIHPTSLHPDIGLVHPPGAVAHPQMRADPLLKFLGIGLDPTEDRCVVDLDAAIEEHQFEIAVADGKHQIPTRGHDKIGATAYASLDKKGTQQKIHISRKARIVPWIGFRTALWTIAGTPWPNFTLWRQ